MAASSSSGVAESRPPRNSTVRAPRRAQLDPGALQLEQVLDRLRQRAEAVAKLVAQGAQLAGLARPRDPPVDVDLRRLERDVVGGQVGVDVDVEPHLRPRRRAGAALGRASSSTASSSSET